MATKKKTTNLFEIIALAEEKKNGGMGFSAQLAREVSKDITEAGYLLATTENIEKTLHAFLEHFAPSAAVEFAKDSTMLAEDFRNMLSEIPSEDS